MGVLLAIITIFFNLWLIPEYGIDGAAIASFLAFLIYNTIKLVYVKLKFNMLPFTVETFKILLLLGVTWGLFYFLHFGFHPLLNIVIKTALMLLFYLIMLYKFRISEDVFEVLARFIKR